MKKEKINLYTAEGWLDIPKIAETECWLNVIIGKRQVGKTYGVLKHLLDGGKKFIYLRRTEKELEMIAQSTDLNPFAALKGYHITIVKNGTHGYVIGNYETDEKGKQHIIGEPVGYAFGLTTIAQMRGFDGGAFADMVLDEFIPINFLQVRQTEGDAVADIYTTINGNRELKGEPPLRLWLLANANNIRNPILESLDLLPIVERLIRSQDEYYCKNGIFVAMPESSEIKSKRDQTALMKHLSRKNGKYYRMAQANEFAYNNLDKVKAMSVKGMQPLCSVDDMCIYLHTGCAYICTVPAFGMTKFKSDEKGLKRVRLEYAALRQLYDLGLVYFATASLIPAFERYFNIDNRL